MLEKSGNINQNGFTLVEIMITLLISVFVGSAIFWTHKHQQNLHTRQEAVIDMQQNIRAGMYLLAQEIRMAAYDPVGSAGSSIRAANGGQLRFEKDITDAAGTAIDGNGAIDGPNEDVTITFNPPAGAIPGNITRDFDGPGGAAPQPFLDNVELLQFVYNLQNGLQTTNPTAPQRDEIESVQITLMVRSPIAEPDLLNTMTYTNGSGAIIPAFNDNFRRRILTQTIQCRNQLL